MVSQPPAQPQRRQIPSPLQGLILWLLGVVVVFGGGLVVSLVAALLALRAGLAPERTFSLLSDPQVSPLVKSSTWLSATILVNELLLALMLYLWFRRHRPPLREILPFHMPPLRALAGALMVVMGVAPAAELCGELVYRMMPREVNAEAMVVAIARGVSPAGLAAVLVAAAFVPAVVEEAMFRGFMTRAFMSGSQALTVLVPSLLFGAFHLEPTQAAGTFILGLGFGLARLCTGSILTSTICHFLYNAAVILYVNLGGQIGDHELHVGRVGLGLALAAIGYVVFLSVPGKRSAFPPPRWD